MSEFFEPPPPCPRQETRARSLPPWVGPPMGTVPGVVPLELSLARTERFAIFVTRLAAYPVGFGFDVLVLAAPGEDDAELPDPMFFGPRRHHHGHRGGGGIPDELLRLGIQFSDGQKATNTSGLAHFETRPTHPVMHGGGGGGGGRRWQQSEWVWPLPPAGPLAFVCEWPAAGISLTRHEIEAEVILDAAHRAEVVFPEDPPPEGTWTATT